MNRPKILLIENQKTQFVKIRERLREDRYMIFPSVDEFTEFADKFRIFLNLRYGAVGESSADRRQNSFQDILNYIQENYIDVLLIDYKLVNYPGKDGIFLASEILKAGIEIPIIFLSSTEKGRIVKERFQKLSMSHEEYPWIEKGYASSSLGDEDYFEAFVVKQIDSSVNKLPNILNKMAYGETLSEFKERLLFVKVNLEYVTDSNKNLLKEFFDKGADGDKSDIPDILRKCIRDIDQNVVS